MSPPSHDPLDRDQLGEQGQNYSAKHQCPRCPCTFKRIEHLNRHVKSHTSQKAFICDVCFKEFARSDILHRHSFTHRTPIGDTGKPKRRRACTECAKARERCSKDEPCRRCLTRGLSCAYPPEPRGRQPRRSPRDDVLNVEAQPSPQAHNYQQVSKPGLQPLLPTSQALTATTPRSTQSAIEMMGADALRRQQQHDHLQIGGANSTGTGPGISNQYLGAMYDPATQMDVDTLFPLVQDQGGFSQSMDYPMNWLPANDTIDIDYSSILDFGIGPYADTSPLALGPTQDISLLPPDTNVGQNNQLSVAGNSIAPGSRRLNDPTVILPPVVSISSPTHTTSSHSQSSGSESRLSTQGGLYATSNDGARVPCTIRSRQHRHIFSGATPVHPSLDSEIEADDFSLRFPALDGIVSQDIEEAIEGISASTYDTILANFQRMCLTPGSFFPPFVNESFPSLDQMNILIQLYFEYFDPIFPIVHKEQVELNNFWPLALSMCVIGCRFTDTQEFTRCIVPFQEFLRRVLTFEVEMNPTEAMIIPLTQALILSQIGLLYSGQRKSFLQARARRSVLTELINTTGASTVYEGTTLDDSDEVRNLQTQQEWELWITAETKRRIGYSAWLLDCMSRYHFGERFIGSTDATQHELPSEDLWNCKTAWQWSRSFRKTEKNPSLASAVTMLFLEKKFKKDIGQFSSLLLLHGVYEEIRRVQYYLDRPLSSWVPSLWLNPGSPPAESDHESAQLSDTKNNLAVWRNAALDCVDVLHWAANATVASAAGVEHSTVLHLHLSRVVLLVPYTSIQTLAKSISTLTADRSTTWSKTMREDALRAEQEVVRWAQQDEHKARLAVLHCGCLYWHIRRYSRRAFYEPVSVFLATLTLWAYSMYASRASPVGAEVQNDLEGIRSGSITRHASPEPPSDQRLSGREARGQRSSATNQLEFEDDAEPTFIRLDRPNDDEMVQQFVKSGRPSVMRAYITGVGNICSPQGPARILREGRKILSSVSSAWSRTQDYISTLESVEAVTTNSHNWDSRERLSAMTGKRSGWWSLAT
ncbi:hypothetical protein PFICI_12745 [Pestalotiopsis fici W106-1]|uniref:Zn(2)-C6 fungal-type domain-containing protein n=1 Tax=Pestalotiopsis fici (strain W106-1 / CGMCC3.15140) TaxID=1229662 RepID=W3WSK0_PESFW|nr:uncharacterized protein PFICI_12745 [Pestalotiopsis fici W106-1]ETS75801.1 hypothetical protein PFICI_12745 [Pestalotiopsis fici W106-1]